MGYNQGETSPHNGMEGWGHLQNRVARGICLQECLYNGGICGGHKAPQRGRIIIIGKSGCGRGYLALLLPIL